MRNVLRKWKKKAMRILSILMVTTLLCPMLSANGVGYADAASKKKVKSVTINKPVTSTLTMKKGSTYQLKVNVSPKNAANKKLTYRSKKNSVVSVTAKGKLTAKKTGKAVINVTAKDGSKKSASITVTVVKKLTKVKRVTLNRKSATLYVGGTAKEAKVALKPTFSPKKATTKKVNYKTSNKNVATVSKNGVVTAKKVGNATITAYAADGWGKNAKCKIRVDQKERIVTPKPTGDPSPTPSNSTSAPSPTSEVTPSPEPVLPKVSKLNIWEELPVPAIPKTKTLYFEDFEQSQGRMGTWSTVAIGTTTDEKYEGSQSLRVFNRKTGEQWACTTLNVYSLLGANPDQEYVFSCWLKSGGDPQPFQVKISNSSGTDQFSGTAQEIGSEWTYFEQRFTVKSDQYAHLKIQADNKGTDYYVDNVMIYKELDGCTCNLPKPVLINDSEILISKDSDKRELLLVPDIEKEDCEVEGHQEAKVQTSYDVIKDEKRIAKLEGDKLTVSGEGAVTVKVSSFVNDEKRFSIQTLTVKKSSQAFIDYVDFAKVEYGGETVRKGDENYIYSTFGGLKPMDEISVNVAKGFVKSASYLKNGEWVKIEQNLEEGETFKLKLSNYILSVGIRIDFVEGTVSNWEGVNLAVSGYNLDLHTDCICQLGTPEIVTNTNVSLVPDTSKDVVLNAETLVYTRGCKESGHAARNVGYQYSIVTGNAATLSNGTLKFTNQGNVTVEVTATLGEIIKKSRKEFRAEIMGYVNWALASNGTTAKSTTYEQEEAKLDGSLYNADAMLDGNRKFSGNQGLGTRWRTNKLPCEVIIDLQQVREIDKLVVVGQNEDGNAYVEPTKDMTSKYVLAKATIQYLDGASWVTFEGGNIQNNNKLLLEIMLPESVKTSKIRIVIPSDHKDGDGNAWARIIAFEAWGPDDEEEAAVKAHSAVTTAAPALLSYKASEEGTRAMATKTPSPTVEPRQGTQLEATDFILADNKKAPNIYLDKDAEDYKGLGLVAKSFVGDVELVADAKPELMDLPTDLSDLEGEIIVFGSIGNNQLIDKWINENKIYVGDIKPYRETYSVITVENPEEGIDKALVVVGSDKRGTIYGIYHISERMGVSPWVYWGDVMPKKQETLSYTAEEINYTSKEPSVKYRGIFLNDEAPSLTSWIGKEFGGPNEQFYEKVYELILRLKGNYLWPAMWGYQFSKDGKSKPIANAELADVYGVIMGTSHHEPMMRAGEEWGKEKDNYGNGKWSYLDNKEGLKKFWEDAVKRNGKYENLITLGIRGEADSPMLPTSATVEDNVKLLKDIITDQKAILKKNGLEDAPTVLTLYKEVEEFWYGDENVEGLKDWDELDDVTIMMTEDNFGNLRTLPTEENKNREKGWGMYYHFDYHGAPTSYEWINTVPLEKTWEQMSMAYDYGVNDVWIVNVGDLKPMEIGISYFLDMAYDFDQWGTNGLNKTEDYLNQWVEQQFGEGVDQKGVEDLSSLIRDYLQLNGNKKPEILSGSTYSLANYNEAQEVLQKAKDMIELADQYKESIPEKFQAAYFQLVYYPAVATANVNMMQIYAGLNTMYYNQGRTSANTYALLLNNAIQEDIRLQNTYNNNMPGVGKKWQGMMSSPHVGYVAWNSEGWAYPTPKYVTPKNGSVPLVAPKGSDKVFGEGECSLPDFTNLREEEHYIDVANAGGTPFAYTAEASEDWIQLSKTTGRVMTQDTINVSIDWDAVKEDKEGTIEIKGAGKTFTVHVKAACLDVSGLGEMTFVETQKAVSIEANHYSGSVAGENGEEWKVINNYGRTDSSVKVFPTTSIFTDANAAPYLEYKVYVDKEGEYTLQSYVAPSNNVNWDHVTMRYAVSVNDETPFEVDTIGENFRGGDYNKGSWANDVVMNIRNSTSKHTLSKGLNTIRIYAVDPALVLQKLVLYRTAEGLKSSYLGPQESYCVGEDGKPKYSKDIADNILVAPGVVEAACHEEDKDANPKDGLRVAKGDAYTYKIFVAATETYKVRVMGGKDKNGKISLSLDGEEGYHVDIGEVEFTEGEITPLSLTQLKQGIMNLTVTGISGEVDLSQINFSLVDTTTGKPVYITASSTLEGCLPETAYDKDESTSWKPSDDGQNSWLEFDYDEKYYFESFTLSERGSNVSAFTIQIFDGYTWTEVYKGTSIQKGKQIELNEKMEGYKVKITFTDVKGAPTINELDFQPHKGKDQEGNPIPVITTAVKNLASSTKGTTVWINGEQPGNLLLMETPETVVDNVKEIVVSFAGVSKVRRIELYSDSSDFLYYYWDNDKWIPMEERYTDLMETEYGVYAMLAKPIETSKFRITPRIAN